MFRTLGWLCLTLLLTCSSASSQSIVGDWQGLLQNTPPLRVVVHIEAVNNGDLRGMAFLIDQTPDGMTLSSAQLTDRTFTFAIPSLSGSYSGTLSPNGQTITGSWTQGAATSLNLTRATQVSAWRQPVGKSSHIVVNGNVSLEVIDWGGTGQSLVLLAGLGNTAHIFDTFAPKLTANFHVVGITRRGFGTSSSPVPDGENYSPDRLGDDVLAVMDDLHLQKAVLVGHSIAGEELSSISSRHPERVNGLIYLEAGYAYALYDQAHGDLMIDAIDLRKRLDDLLPGSGADQQATLQALTTALPRFEKELQAQQGTINSQPKPGPAPAKRSPADAIFAGQQKYSSIHSPTLAIFAAPHDFGPLAKEKEFAKIRDADLERVRQQAKAFQDGVPGALIILIPDASHYIFFSNEADVLRDMNSFVSALPR